MGEHDVRDRTRQHGRAEEDQERQGGKGQNMKVAKSVHTATPPEPIVAAQRRSVSRQATRLPRLAARAHSSSTEIRSRPSSTMSTLSRLVSTILPLARACS